ncbi:MAG: glycoside-pentoside-hexuronide (GPH):cation symporter [Vallitaleaceae bacterium]|nr:glycoside-pentoside-hexuronide (GPH):cation symporter [Vallitaleaceae bacterium]
MKSITKRNHYTYGLGTVGRDMTYALISMYLMFYLTDVLELPNKTLWWVTFIILMARVFDALNDPVMGVVVDNTRSRFGKFKPWIAIGALSSGVFTVLLFTDFGLSGTAFLLLFALIYLLWGISFTANDISYWSMLPSLTTDQKEREKIGAFARICANVGLFTVVAGIVPITTALSDSTGSMEKAYLVFAIMIVAVMWIGQSITLFGVKELDVFKVQPATKLKELVSIIFKNDQLLYTAIAMVLFMIGYITTTSFGLYFFKYAYGDEGMYSIFALILGVSQLVALIVFPLFSKKYNRKQLYRGATFLVVVGYVIFFFAPMNMLYIGAGGILIFLGQAFIQLLMLMFLADTIEYGQWKLGKRNESITFSIQPFINKMGGAVGSGIVGATIILSGINDAVTPEDVTTGGLLMMKVAMLLLPLVFILAGYMIYKFKYRIDAKMYAQILSDLKARGDISE